MPDSCPDTDTLPSRIAVLVHTHFDGLPKRSKPVLRDDGTGEWIPMTGIVLVKGANTPAEQLTCVTVTTGAKCLPASQIPHCNGLVLHDCHAEILAMRAFNYWLLSECRAVLSSEQQSFIKDGEGELNPPAPSPYIRRRRRQSRGITSLELDASIPPFEICPDVDIYMYCTCAPCGDASMELVMAEQDDPTPWALPNTTPTSSTDPEPPRTEGPLLSGRGHFSQLGIVRRKPARADAESTKSKSCSDKMALRQVTSLLSYESSLLVAVTANAYVKGLIMPEEEISKSGCERCFGGGQNGRMRGLNGRLWPINADIDAGTSLGSNEQVGRNKDSESDSQRCHRYSYAFRPFEILSIPNTQLKSLWAFRKPRATHPICEGGSKDTSRPQVKKTKPGTISAVWVRAPTPTRPPNPATESQDSGLNLATPVTDNGAKILPILRGSRTGLFESIINGVRQGHKSSGPGPGIRGASALCRARMWEHWRGTASNTFQRTGDSESSALNKSGDGKVEEAHLSFMSKEISTALHASTYREFKEPKGGLSGVVLARRQAMNAAKEILDGWVPNDGDEGWGWRWNLGELFDARGNPVVMDPKGSKKRKR
ncbi:hypothetical protein BDW67DRAFT_191672 [Aspergillus spinulosporus]